MARGKKKQYEDKGIEKKEKNTGTRRRSCIATQKVCHVKREEYEIDLYGHCCYHGSKPAMTETDMLVGYNDVDGLKQNPCNDQPKKYTYKGENEAIAGNLANGSCFQYRLYQSWNRGSEYHEWYQNDKYQEHTKGHKILLNDVSWERMVNDIEVVLNRYEEA